jgi:hypothetical protein
MAQTIYPSVQKTRRVATLTSGTSWTVPAGVLYINATLVGGGGGGGGQNATGFAGGKDGLPGSTIESTVTTTPGAAITYAIGAGGTAGTGSTRGGTGGTTTFTGATSASGGVGGGSADGNNYVGGTGTVSRASNQGSGALNPNASTNGGVGGSGFIIIEYWV